METDVIHLEIRTTSQAQRDLELVREQQEIRALAARDREVRAHEQAHAAVGGAYAGHPHYQFTQGPNGVRYAHSGHVNIDVSPVAGDPAATLSKMQTVAKAALAPAQPSAADRAVAAKANTQAAQARAELAAQSGERLGAVLHATQPSHEQQRDAQSVGRADPPRLMGSTSGSLVDLVL